MGEFIALGNSREPPVTTFFGRMKCVNKSREVVRFVPKRLPSRRQAFTHRLNSPPFRGRGRFTLAVHHPENSTAPTPLLEVGAGCSQLHRHNRRARSLIHARRRFRRWVYFGFSRELFFRSVRKLFGRSRPLLPRTKAVLEMRGNKEESIFGRQVSRLRQSA